MRDRFHILDLNLLFYLKWCVKHNQFGAGGYEVITPVGLHKPGVHIVLWVWGNERGCWGHLFAVFKMSLFCRAKAKDLDFILVKNYLLCFLEHLRPAQSCRQSSWSFVLKIEGGLPELQNVLEKPRQTSLISLKVLWLCFVLLCLECSH